MPGRNHHNDHNHRGRGGRGRGRGGSNARGRVHENYPHASYELDYVVQRYQQEGFGIPDTRGGSESTPRSRSGGKTPQRGTDSPLRGNGYGTPRGRGQNFGFGNGQRGRGQAQHQASARGRSLGTAPQLRGRGNIGMNNQPPNRDASLSNLLYFERPLLRPIKFVKATYTPFLFQESEEIFQPPSTSNIQSDLPTAERVACIFNNTQPLLPAAGTISEGETSDELEEIDFADLGTFRAQVDAVEHTAQRKTKSGPRNAVVEETFTGLYNKEQPRDVREKSGAEEPEQRRKTGEEKSTAVAAHDTMLRTLEQSIETLQMREHHDVGAFANTSESAYIEPTLSKSNNTRANVELEDNLSTGNTTSKSHDVSEQTAATAGMEHIGADHGFYPPSNEPEENDFADLGTFRPRVDSPEHAVEKKTEPPDPRITVIEETFTGVRNKEQPRTVLEISGAEETEQRTRSGEEESTAVAANDTTLWTLEQSIETLQVRENRDVGAFLGEGSPWNPSESAGIEPTLSKPNNSGTDTELEADPSTSNMAADSHNLFQQRAATAGTGYNGGDHGFFIDTQPTQPFTSGSARDATLTDSSRRGEILGEEEEIIVYVAPHPRPGRIQPTHDITPRVTLPTCSLLTGTSETWSPNKERKDASVIVEGTVSSNPQSLSLHSMSLDFQRIESSTQPRHPAAFTPSQKKKEKLRSKTKESRAARRRNARTQFRAFGAMLSESQLRDADEKERRDPKWETRRKDDSDIEWGDDIDNTEKSGMRTGVGALVADDADRLSNGDGGMDLDSDVGSDMNAMLRFVESMSAEGSRIVTMDDVEDQRQMIEEDQDKASARTAEDSSDEDESGSDDGSEGDEEEAVLQLEEQFMIAESEGEDALPDEEPSIWKRSKNGGRAMHSEDGVDISPSKRRVKAKDKANYLPEDLQAQWERDRAKKAENKRLRKEARMLASLDPSAPKKGGKKARKLMMAALKQMDHLRNELDDMPSIEATMRRFVANIDGRRSMPLLPMKKSTRKIVHELAAAFNLNSSSKGQGEGRYVTLVKTTRTGIINEGKVKGIMKRATRGSRRAEEGSQKKGRPPAPSHREGDEVGKEAPAIGESNVGFKMLSSMGWSEGVKIGGDASVGIEVPLTAVIKKSRLGLGATRT